MSHLLLIVLLLFADDSTLVKAAKANGGLKKPIPKKTITNKDVKKSKGKITELPATGTPASPPASPPAPSLAVHEAHKKAVQMMLPTRFPEQLKERSTAATA